MAVLHLRPSYPLQVYAPEEDYPMAIGTYQSRKPDDTTPWWLQLLGIVGSQLLGIADSVVGKATDSTDRPHPAQATTRLQAKHELLKRHLTNLRATIPNIDALDEKEHIQFIHPPATPWSFPPGTHYREARPGRLHHLAEPLITDLVNLGLLLASPTGIRWKHMDQHILLTIDTPADGDQVPRMLRSDGAAYRRARIRRPGMNGEPNGLEDERTGTPVVPLDASSLAPGEKRVRIFEKRTCVLSDGGKTVVRVEDLEDGEGGSVRGRGMGKGRRRVVSEMIWDSERWG